MKPEMSLSEITENVTSESVLTLSTFMYKGQIKLLICKDNRHQDQEDIILEIPLTDDSAESLVDALLQMLRYKKLDSAFIDR